MPRFSPNVTGMPIIGNKNTDTITEMINPTTVLDITSIIDCFLV